MFDEPDVWRLESDLSGAQRLYRNGVLLVDVIFPDPADGPRVGVAIGEADGEPETSGAVRGRMTRIERFSGGLQAPLGTEELGLWVRIGIDHQTLGTHWLFRGFVEGLEPTYVPDVEDAVRIECVDSLGEAGRVDVDDGQFHNPFLAAAGRIRQILDAASWPKHFRSIFDDATLMSRPSSGKALDGLTQVAESCGGAVYGDPVSGDVVFKGQDWQGPAAGADPEAWITNYRPDFEPGVPRVCPSGWEMSSQRQDMRSGSRRTAATATNGRRCKPTAICAGCGCCSRCTAAPTCSPISNGHPTAKSTRPARPPGPRTTRAGT